jgi:hypothetical protein
VAIAIFHFFRGRNCTDHEIFPREYTCKPVLKAWRIVQCFVEKMWILRSPTEKKFQSGTIRVCSGPINSYAIPLQRIFLVTREFTKFIT